MNSLSSCHLLSDTPELALSSHPVLTISETKKSGLILCKSHYAEFAGPGAAVSTLVEAECVGIIAIGSPEIVRVSSASERQKAYSRRIQWIRWLQKISAHADPIQRAEKLFSSFEAFFGSQVFISLSDEILALLIGVLPSTIAFVRAHYYGFEQFDEPKLLPICASLEPGSLHFEHLSSTLSHDDQQPAASVVGAGYSSRCAVR